MKYEGVVYRPPSEARSLIVQVTIGCAHNTCTFCNMYKDKQFRVRKMEEIMADLQEAHDAYAAYVQKVFLADGDALIMKTEDLLTILAAVKELFPRVTRVAAYGTAQDILRKSEEESHRRGSNRSRTEIKTVRHCNLGNADIRAWRKEKG